MGKLIKEFLSNKLKPLLKDLGYIKKGNSFLRQEGDMIFIINIQGSNLFSWKNHENLYINFGIISAEVERVVGRPCSITETTPSKLLFKQVNLRANDLPCIESDSYLLEEGSSYETCINDIILLNKHFQQIKATEDLYELLEKSSSNTWESTYMRYWALKGEWDRFDNILNKTIQFCEEHRTVTYGFKEYEALCAEFNHPIPSFDIKKWER